MSSRSRLGTSTSDEAWNQGLAMTLEQVLDYALRGTERQNDLSASPLSQRERELATLVAAGLTNREIGQRLFISWRTVEGHLERIRNKLGVRSRTGVATWAVEHGLVSSKADAQPGSSQKRGTRNRPPSGQR